MTASDADFIRSAAHNAAAGAFNYDCRLSDVTDPVSSTGHIIRMRTATDLANQEPVDFDLNLWLGVPGVGTQITATGNCQRLNVTSTTFTDTAYTLSGAQADAITDYTNLYFRFTVTYT